MKVQFPLFGRQGQRFLRRAAAAGAVARRASAASRGLLPLLFCLAVAAVLAAGVHSATAVEPATDVGGPITGSKTWTPAGSPYIVTETVVIQPDAVLDIQPGVEVDFDAGTGLRVAGGGRLEAVGSAEDPITSTAHGTAPISGFWERIFFDDTSLASALGYCVVEYASTGIAIGDTDSHTIDHCTLRYNSDDDDVTSGGAINAVGDVLSITDNLIYDNELGLLLRKSYNDTITGNSIYNNGGFGIGFFAENAPGGGDNLIADNDIHSNGSFGIGFLAQGNYEGGDGNVIDGNAIHDNGGDGLILDGSNYLLDGGDDNQVLDNRIYQNGGAGVWIKNQEGLSLTENIVRDNVGNGLTFVSPIANPDALHSNVLCGNHGYQLQNLGSATITAEGNWFGTNTPGATEINGPVDYTPWIQMAVSLVPNQLPADGVSTATLTLTMNDGVGHAVPDGYTVTVTPSQGTVEPATLIVNGGQATATYTAGTLPGLVEFQASDGCNTIHFTAELELQAVDLVIDKIGPGGTTHPGELVTYTVVVDELNDVDARQVVITDTLPAGATWVSDTSSTCGLVRQSTTPGVVWTKALWAGGTSCQFSVTVRVAAMPAGTRRW